jgi:hypothetical protein
MYSFFLYPVPEDTEEKIGCAAHVASTASTTVMVDGSWVETGYVLRQILVAALMRGLATTKLRTR